MNDLTEKKVASEKIFDGVIVHLYKDTVVLPNGRTATREFIKNSGAVAIVPITDNNEIVMVKQFRYPFNKVMLEIPAGKLEGSENIELCARRELSEETGIECGKLINIGDFCPSVAILTEVIHMFIAKDLLFKQAHTDPDEFIDVQKIPVEEAVSMIVSGRITDGKTQAAVMKAYYLMERGIV